MPKNQYECQRASFQAIYTRGQAILPVVRIQSGVFSKVRWVLLTYRYAMTAQPNAVKNATPAWADPDVGHFISSIIRNV